VITVVPLFLLDKNNREKEEERIKLHVSMKVRVVSKVVKK